MGARPLARIIDTEIKIPLSKQILFGNLTNNTTIRVDYSDGKFNFVDNMTQGEIKNAASLLESV